jgi:hypothetical protein
MSGSEWITSTWNQRTPSDASAHWNTVLRSGRLPGRHSSASITSSIRPAVAVLVEGEADRLEALDLGDRRLRDEGGLLERRGDPLAHL